MNWYLEALKKYADFRGRARRSEFWYFTLINILIITVLGTIDSNIGTYDIEADIGLLEGIFVLAVAIPSLAVSVRRLHDTNRSGWWFLLVFIPLIGPIILLVFMILDSQPAKNQYGQDSKVDQV